MVKTLLPCRSMGSIPALRTKIPHAAWCGKKKKNIYIYIYIKVKFVQCKINHFLKSVFIIIKNVLFHY